MHRFAVMVTRLTEGSGPDSLCYGPSLLGIEIAVPRNGDAEQERCHALL